MLLIFQISNTEIDLSKYLEVDRTAKLVKHQNLGANYADVIKQIAFKKFRLYQIGKVEPYCPNQQIDVIF